MTRLADRRTTVAAAVVAITAAAVAFGIFGSRQAQPAIPAVPTVRSIALLATDAPPADVLDAYLAAFRANDCATADKLTTKAFSTVNGDLCGTVSIDSYTHPTHPATTNGEIIYGITLHVVGRSKDGTIPAGDLQWFYTLQHQTDGSWRLIGGGTGP